MNSLGYVRVAVASPSLRVADIRGNVDEICKVLRDAERQLCQLVLLPELAITGYSCADLFYQSVLLSEAQASLVSIAQLSGELGIAVVVGLPFSVGGRIYNCAAFCAGGAIAGIVPKTYLPTTNEYYEERWFASAKHCGRSTVQLLGREIPFGADLLFRASNLNDCVIGIEICEDLWAVQPPSGDQALSGATILLNPSASDELLGKSDYRRDLVKQQSARCLASYVYAGAGPSESTTDLVFGGHSLIVENGLILTETERFCFATQLAIADIDVQRLQHERIRSSSFSTAQPTRDFRTIEFSLPERAVSMQTPGSFRRSVARMPFVPSESSHRAKHCREVFAIQSTGLAKRLLHTGAATTVIGVSGGLDSTLALLVIIQAYKMIGWPRERILGITMPGFGTTERTQNNASQLMALLGVTPRVISIRDAVRQHFEDIGHDTDSHDITYENAQARERTQILMDLANETNGLVIGTGDLSELALGWCTYNADHMSMYNVNVGVPKTLVRYLIEWVAETEFTTDVSTVLRDICATPITPELLPLAAGNTLQQMTEESIGPYELHDFFLYNFVRHQFSPAKIIFLAKHAYGADYTDGELHRWITIFYKRFFSQQFKRSALPDGPKVGSVALSPRGDWRMPSDASSDLWLNGESL